MGIYERDWYRRERPRFTLATTSMVTILIVVNVAFYLIQLILYKGRGWEPLSGGLGLSPDDVIRKFKVWQLVTSLFLHDPRSAFHLIFNMFVLWMFGRHVEMRLGRWVFFRFYMAAGLAASIAYVVLGLIPDPQSYAVGASGAIMAVVVYFTMLNPNARVLLFFFLPMRMVWALAAIIAIDLLGFAYGEGNIAHSAHLGGVLFGFLYYRYAHRIDRFFLNMEIRSKTRSVRPDASRRADLEAEVDRLLDKVRDGGLDSLSEKERNFLRDASDRLRGGR